MKVSKSNPLNSLYQLWIGLGGKASELKDHRGNKYNYYVDNLCHFMRVVLIWVWFRWLFKCRQMFIYIKGGINISPFLVGLLAFMLGMFTSLMVHWPEFREVIFVVAGTILGFIALVYVFEKTRLGSYIIENQKQGMIRRKKFWAPKIEAFELFKDWLYAKNMRICPQIKVEL